jgi:3-dehydroquinate synthase
MAVITRSCAAMGICSDETCRQIVGLIKRCDLPVTTVFNAKGLSEAALSDKKRSGGTITLILPKEIGQCVLQDMATNELEHFIGLGL